MAVQAPDTPDGFGPKALAIWEATVEGYDLRVDELRILEDACREVDLVERMEKEIASDRLIVPGSTGQPVANELVKEIRQHRAVVKSLFAALKLPEDDERENPNPRSVSARNAAKARWRKGA